MNEIKTPVKSNSHQAVQHISLAGVLAGTQHTESHCSQTTYDKLLNHFYINIKSYTVGLSEEILGANGMMETETRSS